MISASRKVISDGGKVISANGKVISARWKGDLSWYRRFNPQGGPFAKQKIFFKVLQ